MAHISDKKADAARLAIICAGLALALLVLVLWLRGGEERVAQAYDIRIIPLATEAGVEVLYRTYGSVSEIALPFPADQIASLSIGESANVVSVEAAGDGVVLKGSKSFELVGVVLDRNVIVPRKDYPVAQFGTNALVLNMARFTPSGIDGRAVGRVPAPGATFQWVSKAPAIEVGETLLFADPALPVPVSDAYLDAARPLGEYYGKVFEKPLPTPPQFMLLYEAGFKGQLTIAGDTVAGQSLIKFTGEAFQNDTKNARLLVMQNLAHEYAHLFQLEEPGVAAAPDWLHEGGAEALANEAMFISGLWNAGDYLYALTEAKKDCAEALKAGPVRRAPEVGNHQASYACGQGMMIGVAARREGRNVGDMWRAFRQYAQMNKADLSDETFFAFTQDWSGDEAFVRSLRKFVQTDYSLADRADVVEQMLKGEL